MAVLGYPCYSEKTAWPTGWPQLFINRRTSQFAARFRAANSFLAASFDSRIEPETAAAYGAMLRFGLVYAAWDLFLSAFSLASDRCRAELEAAYDTSKARSLLDADLKDGQHLFVFLKEHASRRQVKEEIERVIESRRFAVIDVAAYVRNVLVHGNLTAGPAEIGKARVRELVDALSDILMAIMNGEAATRAKRRLDAMQRSRANQPVQSNAVGAPRNSGAATAISRSPRRV